MIFAITNKLSMRKIILILLFLSSQLHANLSKEKIEPNETNNSETVLLAALSVLWLVTVVVVLKHTCKKNCKQALKLLSNIRYKK